MQRLTRQVKVLDYSVDLFYRSNCYFKYRGLILQFSTAASRKERNLIDKQIIEQKRAYEEQVISFQSIELRF